MEISGSDCPPQMRLEIPKPKLQYPSKSHLPNSNHWRLTSLVFFVAWNLFGGLKLGFGILSKEPLQFLGRYPTQCVDALRSSAHFRGRFALRFGRAILSV